MDISKKYGSIGTGTWVELDDAKFKLLPPSSRAAAANKMYAYNFKEFKDGLSTQVVGLGSDDPDERAKAELDLQHLLDERERSKSVGDFAEQQARETASLIVDWSGLQEDGVNVPYSKQKAFELCFYIREFKNWVEQQTFIIDEKNADVVDKKAAIKKK